MITYHHRGNRDDCTTGENTKIMPFILFNNCLRAVLLFTDEDYVEFFLSKDRHSPLVVFFNHQKHILIGFWHPKTFYFSVDVEQNCFEWRDYYQDIFYFPIFFPESVMVATLLWLQLWHHLLWLCHYLWNMTFYFHFFIFYGRNTFFLT